MNDIFFAYHAVTERPMYLGQHIVFDQNHQSGVHKRVMDKLAIVQDIYSNPEKYRDAELAYPVVVALRELALEEIREKNLKMAAQYWENKAPLPEKPQINEILASGDMEVVKIVKEYQNVH